MKEIAALVGLWRNRGRANGDVKKLAARHMRQRFFAGLALDSLLGTRPLLILVGTTFGVAAAMYTIWDVARKAMRK